MTDDKKGGATIKCRNCGEVLNVSPSEKPDERTPCPSCGSTSRAIEKIIRPAHLRIGPSHLSWELHGWIYLPKSSITRKVIISICISFIGFLVGFLIEGGLGLGSLVGFSIAVIVSCFYSFLIDNKFWGLKDKR